MLRSCKPEKEDLLLLQLQFAQNCRFKYFSTRETKTHESNELRHHTM